MPANLSTIIVGLVVILICVLAYRRVRKQKGGCGCGCEGCGGSCSIPHEHK